MSFEGDYPLRCIEQQRKHGNSARYARIDVNVLIHLSHTSHSTTANTPLHANTVYLPLTLPTLLEYSSEASGTEERWMIYRST